MKILIVGPGAREHALAWRLLRSGHELDAAPGNPGIAEIATCHPVADVEGLCGLAERLRPALVVVGPEAPLVLGLADRLRAMGIPVFGPGQGAAMLEGSKAFAKEIMHEAGIPTAAWRAFTDADEAERYAVALGRAVVKADGLAAGKGVIVAPDPDAARDAVRSLMREGSVGEAGSRLVVEEFLEGPEASAIALCDGARYWMLPSSQDHKRIGDGDTGPNTGGMGAYSPTPALPEEALARVGREVVAPVLETMARRGTPFIGALYVGLMMTKEGPKVLEFNCRFGDPETQALMMRLEGDLGAALLACATGKLGTSPLTISPDATVAVVLAAHGYPASPRKGDAILGLDRLTQSDRLAVFHAGTRVRAGDAGRILYTDGGRVLTVVARGRDVARAREAAYEAAGAISFDGMQMRRDIALKGM